MGDYFLDSSAIVKRYVNEVGSSFVNELFDSDEVGVIFIAEIARVEVASAFARLEKGKTLAPQDAATGRAALSKDVSDTFDTVSITSRLVTHAVDLATRYALRGYDAVQLAAALATNSRLAAAAPGVLTFVSADNNLNEASLAEGLTVENPNDH